MGMGCWLSRLFVHLSENSFIYKINMQACYVVENPLWARAMNKFANNNNSNQLFMHSSFCTLIRSFICSLIYLF